MEQIKYSLRKNLISKDIIKRQEFYCLQLNIPNEGHFMNNVVSYAKAIEESLNPGQANSSEIRDSRIVELDNLAGIIAELACERFLRFKYGDDIIIKSNSHQSKNQVDIMLYNKKTIEVRSSCVRNGIDFALFASDRNHKDRQYFDVIGPYSNDYKHNEVFKDYYMRVLYECDKKDFMKLREKTSLTLYITGGATKDMMLNKDIYQDKHLYPAGGEVNIESDYRVIPLVKSLDIYEFLKILEMENNLVSK